MPRSFRRPLLALLIAAHLLFVFVVDGGVRHMRAEDAAAAAAATAAAAAARFHNNRGNGNANNYDDYANVGLANARNRYGERCSVGAYGVLAADGGDSVLEDDDGGVQNNHNNGRGVGFVNYADNPDDPRFSGEKGEKRLENPVIMAEMNQEDPRITDLYRQGSQLVDAGDVDGATAKVMEGIALVRKSKYLRK
jgi:hypothetical protein